MAQWEIHILNINNKDFEQRKTYELHSEDHHMNSECPLALAETQSCIRAAS